jgi:hypothetical protein
VRDLDPAEADADVFARGLRAFETRERARRAAGLGFCVLRVGAAAFGGQGRGLTSAWRTVRTVADPGRRRMAVSAKRKSGGDGPRTTRVGARHRPSLIIRARDSTPRNPGTYSHPFRHPRTRDAVSKPRLRTLAARLASSSSRCGREKTCRVSDRKIPASSQRVPTTKPANTSVG